MCHASRRSIITSTGAAVPRPPHIDGLKHTHTQCRRDTGRRAHVRMRCHALALAWVRAHAHAHTPPVHRNHLALLCTVQLQHATPDRACLPPFIDTRPPPRTAPASYALELVRSETAHDVRSGARRLTACADQSTSCRALWLPASDTFARGALTSRLATHPPSSSDQRNRGGWAGHRAVRLQESRPCQRLRSHRS